MSLPRRACPPHHPRKSKPADLRLHVTSSGSIGREGSRTNQSRRQIQERHESLKVGSLEICLLLQLFCKFCERSLCCHDIASTLLVSLKNKRNENDLAFHDDKRERCPLQGWFSWRKEAYRCKVCFSFSLIQRSRVRTCCKSLEFYFSKIKNFTKKNKIK